MDENTLLVLASNSPRRKSLLALSGWKFRTMPADVNESIQPNEAPADYVLRLAQTKATDCAICAREGSLVVAADTTVVLEDDVLGKPRNATEAVEMLIRLRGRTHQVYTGVAVLTVNANRLLTDLCVTDVEMRDYGQVEIDEYVATGDPLDKAGAYAIQHPKFQPVGKITGCFASVMGLPLCHLERTLRRFEVLPVADVPGNCQSHLNYQCLISRAVLSGEQVG